MNTVVLLKQVHDPSMARTSLRVAADGRTLQLPPGAKLLLNGYDANALEEALRLREKRGGSVTAMSVGGEEAKEGLRRALAMGADKVIHVAGTAGLAGDSDIIASLLSAAIRTIGAVELVLAGRSASDTDAGVVPIIVAARLGMAVVTPVRGLSADETGTLVADRITDHGVRRIRIGGAAVVCVSNEINKPRSPQLRGVAAAKRATIPTVTAEQLGVGTREPAVQLRRLFVPERPTTVAEIIAAASAADAGRALADRLHQEGLL